MKNMKWECAMEGDLEVGTSLNRALYYVMSTVVVCGSKITFTEITPTPPNVVNRTKMPKITVKRKRSYAQA